MPGITALYVFAAHDHINKHLKNATTDEISRAEVEFTLLKELDKASFPMEYKIAWYHAILNLNDFESLWLSMKTLHDLSDEAITRFVPDPSYLTYQIPKAMTPGPEEREEDDPDLYATGQQSVGGMETPEESPKKRVAKKENEDGRKRAARKRKADGKARVKKQAGEYKEVDMPGV
ncbi:MAG: hypothetical protein M1827_000189 [Pycnora praestabilis]|nr:MAG: hypothetical protein M1827_000189 [Pycnora praestabilis]